MPSPKVTAEEREQALAIHREHGPGEASRQTGIPRTTIASWAVRDRTHPDASSDAELRRARNQKGLAAARLSREERAARLAADLLRIAEERVGIILAHKDEITSVRDIQTLMTTVGIAIDKSQLLAGLATARVESGEDIAALRDELVRRSQERPRLVS